MDFTIDYPFPGWLRWFGRYVRALVIGQARAWWHFWRLVFTGQHRGHFVYDTFRGRPLLWIRWGTACTCGEIFFDADDL